MYDLDEVAGGVFRREGAEARARSHLDGIDLAGQVKLRIGIHVDADLLSRTHVFQLRLLEIRRYPGLGRNQGHQGLADLHIDAVLDIAFGYPAVLRRGDFRVRQIDFRLGQVGLDLRHLPLRLADLGVGGGDVLGHQFGFAEPGVGVGEIGPGGPLIGFGQIDLLLGGGAAVDLLLPFQIGFGSGQRGGGGIALRLR